ncbi:MAG: TetR/AcrR family transcriptional regulator [Rhodospirillales bacterium]
MTKASGGQAKRKAAAKRPAGAAGISDEAAARLLDAAVRLGEKNGWDNVRLSAVAEEAGISLPDLRARYRDLNAVADAFFERALYAMLAARPRGFAVMTPRERIETLLLAWFESLTPHRRLAVQMLQSKLWLFHPHHWVPMVFDLSRLIQWLRDAAGLSAAGRRRQIEEIGLTSLFLAALAVWSRDETPDMEITRRFLSRRLVGAERIVTGLFSRPS